MDKETLSNYGWIVICVLVMVVMIALAGPFGNFVSEAVQSTTKGLFDVNKNALDAADIPIDDQEFNVPNGNGGAETPVANIITFTIDGTEYQADSDMNWNQWVVSDYNTFAFRVLGGGYVANGYGDEYVFDNSKNNETNADCCRGDEKIVNGASYVTTYYGLAWE